MLDHGQKLASTYCCPLRVLDVRAEERWKGYAGS